MENQELLLLEIEEFDRTCQNDTQQTLSQNLENFIEYVAKTGVYLFPWNKIKKIYLIKMQHVIDLFNQISNMDTLAPIPNFENIKFNQLKERILERMKSFTSAPFTIQRISELLLKPQLNYSRTDKYLRGLEKCVMVVTTVDPMGNKIFTDLPIMNGILNEINGNGTVEHSPKPLDKLTVFDLPPPTSILVLQQSDTDMKDELLIKTEVKIEENEVKHENVNSNDDVTNEEDKIVDENNQQMDEIKDEQVSNE